MYSEKISCENFEPRKDVIEKVRSRQLSIFCNKDSFESIQINLKEPSLDVSPSEKIKAFLD